MFRRRRDAALLDLGKYLKEKKKKKKESVKNWASCQNYVWTCGNLRCMHTVFNDDSSSRCVHLKRHCRIVFSSMSPYLFLLTCWRDSIREWFRYFLLSSGSLRSRVLAVWQAMAKESSESFAPSVPFLRTATSSGKALVPSVTCPITLTQCLTEPNNHTLKLKQQLRKVHLDFWSCNLSSFYLIFKRNQAFDPYWWQFADLGFSSSLLPDPWRSFASWFYLRPGEGWWTACRSVSAQSSHSLHLRPMKKN